MKISKNVPPSIAQMKTRNFIIFFHSSSYCIKQHMSNFHKGISHNIFFEKSLIFSWSYLKRNMRNRIFHADKIKSIKNRFRNLGNVRNPKKCIWEILSENENVSKITFSFFSSISIESCIMGASSEHRNLFICTEKNNSI